MSDSQSNNENMSVLDALDLGQQLLANKQLDDAEDLYRQMFRVIPEHAEVTHMLGLVLMKKNRSEEASVLIEKSLQLNPIYLDAQINLGNAYLKLNFQDRAEAQFRSALRTNQDSTEALCSLANILKRTGNPAEAISCYRRTITIDPGHRAANTNLCLLLHKLQRHDEACEISKTWLINNPDSESAKMLHASLSGENVPDRASDEYVRNMFDSSAADFDAHLATLDYRAPQLAQQAIEAYYSPTDSLSILDAGCGTGLCGPFLKNVSGHLTGVDLSPEMIKQAERRRCYDNLEVAELTDYLSRTTNQFDLIVCMDTFCYFGPLHQVLELTARALKNGGRLVLSLEKLESQEDNFNLHPGQRYSHSVEYVQHVLSKFGLQIVEMRNEVLRKESKQVVNGLFIVVQNETRMQHQGNKEA